MGAGLAPCKPLISSHHGPYRHAPGAGVSEAGTVAYVAHVVGFVAGMLLAWPLRPGTPPPPEPRGLLWGRQARPRQTWRPR
ncbi:hypothetical protein GCM10010094_69010 [Streptomyces flaveus]|uniref:Uncharacterized protein n=1 Tax=Streptomyces flaveus TaxID=66370 RepID=A0A917VM95_9ACTN|nr:hypothetical protein GCM10010094_69010 [Streptomyces flaveus]